MIFLLKIRSYYLLSVYQVLVLPVAFQWLQYLLLHFRGGDWWRSRTCPRSELVTVRDGTGLSLSESGDLVQCPLCYLLEKQLAGGNSSCCFLEGYSWLCHRDRCKMKKQGRVQNHSPFHDEDTAEQPASCRALSGPQLQHALQVTLCYFL